MELKNIKTLPIEDIERMAKVGKMALKDEREDIKPPKGKYQYYSMA